MNWQLFVDNSLPQDNLGELAALTAAFWWAGSSVIYSRLGQSIPPLQLNFGKWIIAIALLLITLAWRSEPLADLRLFSVILLLISGIIGIGLGDTAYFAALNHLGARRTLLLETLLTLRSIGAIAIAAFGSTYLGIWLQQTALKFSPTGIAQTLLATSPLFILPLAALMGEKISSQAIGGVLIAVSGIFVLST